MNKKKIVILGTLSLLIVCTIFIANFGKFEETYTVSEQQKIVREEGVEINEVLADSKKITSFIAHRLPEESAAVELEHSKHGHDVSDKDLLKNLFEQLFTGILAQDIDFVSVAFTPEAMRSVLKNEGPIDPEEMMTGIREFNTVLGSNDTLSSLDYTITKRINETELQVQLTLSYMSGEEKNIPLDVIRMGDEDHAAFQISTFMTDILSYYEKQDDL